MHERLGMFAIVMAPGVMIAVKLWKSGSGPTMGLLWEAYSGSAQFI